jgi:DNA adenine methylase
MHLSSVKAHRGTVHTPLRYPGGKTRLAGFLKRVVVSAGWTGCTYVEPYAGGAGAALSLLHDDIVSSVVINDLDPRIHAFWDAAVNHSESFLRRFDETPLTLDEWHVQRDIYRLGDRDNVVALGFASFFLNRTNRSGIMNAGVIGGQAQAGKYKIDARFNREDLRSKLVWLASVRDRITVRNDDGVELLGELLQDAKTFAYIDPPYYDKGSFLYLNSFAEASHAALADTLRECRAGQWILTYDDVPAIRALYRGFYQGTFALPYSAHTASIAKERMVLSDAVARLNDVMV